MNRLAKLMFPAEPRSFPGRRGVKVLLRALHVLCTGFLTGAYLFEAGPPARAAWWAASMVTGLAILLLDLHESGVFLLQVRGIWVLAKIAALAALPLLPGREIWMLSGLVVVSVVISHAPGKLRYFVIVGGGRLHGAETKG